MRRKRGSNVPGAVLDNRIVELVQRALAYRRTRQRTAPARNQIPNLTISRVEVVDIGIPQRTTSDRIATHPNAANQREQ
jgi:hypothetical protein